MFLLVSEATQDPIVAPVFERLRRRWGTVLNLYRVLAWSPELVRSWAAFAWSLRFEVKASRRLRELLIVRIAGLLEARYEYEHHLRMALDEGVSPQQIAILDEWKDSELFDEHERCILMLADELALSAGATPKTMTTLRSSLGDRHAIELLVTGAFYCGVARIINSTQLELEKGHEKLRPRDDGAPHP